jgi:hypothetical protein
VVRRRKREKMASYKKNTCLQFLIKKKRDGEREKSLSLYFYLLIYGCCPGGAWPAGLVAGFCVNPPPWHTGCCPPG